MHLFYSCISPALVLIHSDQKNEWTRSCTWTWNGEQKKSFPVIQKRDFKGSFTKRMTFREKIRKQASYALSHFFPAFAKLHWLQHARKKQPCLSAALILSPVGSNCSHCCSAQAAQRRGSQQLDTDHDFWHRPVGLVLPSLSNSCFWK